MVHAPPFTPVRAARPGLWTTAELAWTAHERPDAVATLGLRTTSGHAADALALAATAGRFTAEELRADLPRCLDRAVTDPEALAGLALLWSALGPPQTLAAGASAYRWLHGRGELPAAVHHHQGAAQAAFLAGRPQDVRAMLPSLDLLPPVVRHYLDVDLAHPLLTAGADPVAWQQLLSAPFVEQGLAPVTVAQDSTWEHLFDRLRARAPRTVHGPLVTVVIPCWRPDEGLLTSVASITGQTYADLEIVLVDDASGPGYEDLFAQACGDERVRLLRMPINGGSYLARRAAIAEAAGSLVTTQDADDWSHPERIERQVAALQDHPAAPASRSLAVRAKDDLTHQWFGYPAVRDNASSLMVRRSVMDRVGTFLPIRKSADSEYAERLAHLVGPVVDTGTPLAVTRLRTGSLSRGDFSYQWHHPDRVVFRGAYRAWHRALAAGTSRPTDADMPQVPVPFARGPAQVPTPPPELALCLVGDLSAAPGQHPWADDLLGGQRSAAGLPAAVGLWHLESPLARTRSRREMHPGWFDLLTARDDLHVLTRTHPCRVGTLVVLDPSVLLLAQAQPTAVRAEEVLLGLDERSLTPGPSGLPTDVLGAAQAVRDWFGVPPRWVAGPGAQVGAILEAVPGLDVEPWPFAAGPGRPAGSP